MNRACIDPRKKRRHAPPPRLDTTCALKRPLHAHGHLAPGTRPSTVRPGPLEMAIPTPTTGSLSPSSLSPLSLTTATATPASRIRTRHLTNFTESFKNNEHPFTVLLPLSFSLSPTPPPSCLSPAKSIYANHSRHNHHNLHSLSTNTQVAPTVERATRPRLKTLTTLYIPSSDPESLTAAFVVPQQPLRIASDTKTKFTATLPSPRHRSRPSQQGQQNRHPQKSQARQEAQSRAATEHNRFRETARPQRGRRLRAMTFHYQNHHHRDSLNSASTCVDSPMATLPVARMSGLHAKCQDLMSYHDREFFQGDVDEDITATGNAGDCDDDAWLDEDDGYEEGEAEGNADIDLERDGPAPVAGQELLLENEVEVMPWLQEAIQTVSALEARLVELEEDCKSIPLYEQDRVQMIQLIQEFDSVVQQEQSWIENAENAIHWTAFALEEALLSSSSHATPPSASHASRDPRSNLLPGDFSRRSFSEGALPSLATAAAGDDWTKARSIAAGEHEKGQESDADKGQRDKGRIQQQWGLVLDSSKQQDLEVVYRNAIMTALRHLKTIERCQSIVNDDKRDADGRRKSGAPDVALKEWLENASMMSLVSQKYQCDEAEDDMEVDEISPEIDIDGNGDNDDGDSVANQTDAGRSEERRDSINNPVLPSATSRLAASDPKSHRGSRSVESTTGSSLLHHISASASSRILDHSASAASIQATISGSSQSLKTDLGGCLMDERIFLKQHIQALDRLRLEERERHQKAEQAHRQLISDMVRFSTELLHNVNDLTCAQAALGEASELTLMTLKTVENDCSNSENVAHGKGGEANLTKRKRMSRISSLELAESIGMVETGIKRMRTLAADCVGITELAQKLSETTSAAEEPKQITANDSAVAPNTQAPLSIVTRTDLLKTVAPVLRTSYESQPKTPLTAATSRMSMAYMPASTSWDQGPSSIFVDGIAFQEFEGHLVSLRTSLESNSMRLVNNRMNTMSARSSVISTRNSAAASQQPLSSMDTTPYMTRVLVEDIYPCLLVHPQATPTKQSGWMSSFLSSSSTTSASFGTKSAISPYGANPQTPWLQGLLKAMEKNACEVEFWNTNRRGSGSLATATPATATPKDGTASAMPLPPNAPCCLCNIVRPCEFRLRLVDQDADCDANKKSSQPLDRFCRDRVVAICDFYMFLAHLRQGLLNQQSDLELFRRAQLLRQRMGCARIGSIDIVQALPTAQLSNAGRE